MTYVERMDLSLKAIRQSFGQASIDFRLLLFDSSVKLYCVIVSVDGAEKSICGIAVNENKNYAAYCSVMELLERVFLLNGNPGNLFALTDSFLRDPKTVSDLERIFPNSKNWIPPNSNGIAIHETAPKAKGAAIEEALERHTILKAIAENIAPMKISATFVPRDFQVPEPYSLQLFLWRGPLDHNVVIARLKAGTRCIYGFGCSRDLLTASKKAFKETLPKFLLLRDSSKESVALFNANQHFKYHLTDKSKEFSDFLDSSSENSKSYIDKDFRAKDLWLREINYSKSQISSLGYSVFQALSPKLQPLFSGPWVKESLNPAALSSSSYPKGLHPIG